ncbi:osteoclast-associated immunoglobulin-like receptor isoform X2 [Pyxicephalus adspersus]
MKEPVLEVHTNDPNYVFVIGQDVQLNCINSTNADKFLLLKDGSNKTAQDHGSFTISDLKTTDSGEYTCKQGLNAVLSKPSESQYIYVREKYPSPKIMVKPRKMVQRGEDITITCKAPYPNIQFTIYKDMKSLKDIDESPHVIPNAGENDVGQYMCSFRTKPGWKPQIQSDYSNPVTIQLQPEDLFSPSVSWVADVSDDKYVNIICQAPEKNPRMVSFYLFNSSKDIQEEILDVEESRVIFNISSRDHTQKKYYCSYAKRMGSNLAVSPISKPVVIWRVDYTTRNIIRLFISAVVLILLGFILVKHFQHFQETEEQPPRIPPARRTHTAKSDYTEMVIMSTENVTENTLDTAAPNN